MAHEAVPPMVLALLERARHAAEFAYAPYSRFSVGAAIESDDGAVYVGCNIENASFGLTLCAERTAAALAISQGAKRWKRIAVVSPTSVAPCGACRQFLKEFDPELEVWIGGLDALAPIRRSTLKELLPDAISRSDIP